jgi:dTDP-4-dehydrorhamnose reductase
MAKILVFGKEGQLAQAFAKHLASETVFLGHTEANFLHADQVLKHLDTIQPDLVLNCSGYTAVDLAETERDACLAVNATTPGKIASWCVKRKTPLIHFSTDYVFSGAGEKPWSESDQPKPLNFYGESKWAGEKAISQVHREHLIFRVSWLYSEVGKNFVKTMVKLGSEREELKVVNDQVGYPAYVSDIAEVVSKLVIPRALKSNVPWGIYHLAGPDPTNWNSFAQTIFKEAEAFSLPLKIKRVLPISTSEYVTPAKRPLNSRLDSTKFKTEFETVLPPWQKSLAACLQRISKEGKS